MAIDKIAVWDDGQYPIIRLRGNFNWIHMYRFARHWIEDQRFRYYEKRYKHKGDEVEVEMRGDRKINSMFRYHVEVDFHVWDLKEVEVIEGTKTVKTNSGRIQIIIKGSVECDYSDRFKGGKLHETLGQWWFKVMEKDIEVNHIDGLAYLLYSLHEKLKKLLNVTGDSNAYQVIKWENQKHSSTSDL